MNYVQSLRQFVGHAPLLIPGFRAILTNELGQILLHERTDFKGTWSFPGGMAEYGESIEQCMRREVMEETGIEVLDFEVVGSASNPVFESFSYPNEDKVQLFALVFWIKHWAFAAEPQPDETLAIRFFDLSDLPPMRPNELRTLRFYSNFLETKQFQLH